MNPKKNLLLLASGLACTAFGFAAGRYADVTIAWLTSHEAAEQPTGTRELPDAELLRRCHGQLDDLRQRLHRIDSERRMLSFERRFHPGPAQLERIAREDRNLSEMERHLQTRFEKLVATETGLRERINRSHANAIEEPNWLVEARIRLKLDSAESGAR